MELILNNIDGFTIGMEFCCVLFCLVFVLYSKIMPGGRFQKNGYIYSQISAIIAMIADLLAYFTSRHPQYLLVFTASCFLSFIFAVGYVVCFYEYLINVTEQSSKKTYQKIVKCWVPIYGIFICLVYISSYWSKLIYIIKPNALYQVSEAGYLTVVMMIPIILAIVMVILDTWKTRSKSDTTIYVLYMIMSCGVAFLDSLIMTSFHFLAVTIFGSLLFMQEEKRIGRMLEEKNKEILMSELNALRLQMNPHYIYNTLASVDGLCILNPEKARELISRFIKHLRGSYLTNLPHKIIVSKELENLKYYLEVESIRFPNLKMKFDIQTSEFFIPPLVIQPLVENAIKHGICAREDSAGTVEIKTYETESAYCVRVIDDGVGFEVDKLYDTENSNHIGISNARKRLELLCNGTIDIHSIPELGTSVDIIIPKEEGKV